MDTQESRFGKRKKPPVHYREVMEQGGTVEKLTYETNTYDDCKQKISKSLNVYLPKGYDFRNSSVSYDIFYLMHGGGENQDTLLTGPDENSELKCILDHMIANGDIKPMIIVTPCFYNEGNQNASALVRNFYQELTKDIMPMIESRYHTYAKGTKPEDFKESREHRAFGGFSMGGACTWYTYINCLDFFKYFMPLSGDCWQLADMGGAKFPKETAQFLADVAVNSGYQKKDYYIYCSTGSEDIAYPNLTPQVEEMKLHTEAFTYTDNGENGNFCYAVTEGTTHWWHYVYDYIYESLPFFFR